MNKNGMNGRYLFSAEWCGPCKMAKAALPKDSDIKIVDVDEFRPLALELGVRKIPQLLTLENGEVISRAVGDEVIGKLK